MCRECSSAFLQQRDIGLNELLDRFHFPVLAVDGDAVVLGANHEATVTLGKPVEALVQQRGGVAIECKNAATLKGCGRSLQCTGCLLRNTITATFMDGQPRYSVFSDHSVGSAATAHDVRIRFSTIKLESMVVVTVEGLQDVAAREG